MAAIFPTLTEKERRFRPQVAASREPGFREVDMNGSKSNITNTVLMTIVGLLIGVIAGYWIGRGEQPQTPTTGLSAQSPTGACVHELAPEDTYILAGFRCPGTETSRTALLDCHCAVAHGIKDRVKAGLAEGRTGEQIRAELQAEYGDRFKFSGQ